MWRTLETTRGINIFIKKSFITKCGVKAIFVKQNIILQSEQSLISIIIPETHQSDIFDVLIQSSIETLVSDGDVS